MRFFNADFKNDLQKIPTRRQTTSYRRLTLDHEILHHRRRYDVVLDDVVAELRLSGGCVC